MSEARENQCPARQDAPQGPKSTGPDLATVIPGRSADYICLTHRVLGVLVHYVDGRSAPCAGLHGACKIDHASNKPRWQGWLGVQIRPFHPVQFLPITVGAIASNPLLLDQRYSLRGSTLQARRAGSTSNTRCLVYFGATFYEGKAIAYAPDIRTFLARLWRLETTALLDFPDPHWGEDDPPIFHHLAELETERRMLESKRGHDPFIPNQEYLPPKGA